MDIYEQKDSNFDLKQDSSPLTRADLASHRIIQAGLSQAFPELPFLSEESEEICASQRQAWSRYWLVDPLDGTKEFLRRNGEFTVNIALIERDEPILGVVYAPVLDRLYWGYDSTAWRQQGPESPCPIHVIRKLDAKLPLQVVASRSHRSEELEHFLERLPEHECVAMGSSLKLCLIAEGKAHLYPRIGPTMEWDTAAADAIVRAAGGSVATLDGEALRYNKESLLNPSFMAQCEIDWRDLSML